MANTNTNTTTNNNATLVRFCHLCGKKFETTNKLARLCDDCKATQKKRVAEKQKEYAKKRTKELNLTTIIVGRETRDKIKRLAQVDNTNMASMLEKIVNAYDKDNTKDNVINISDKKPVVKAIKKTTAKKATNKKIMSAWYIIYKEIISIIDIISFFCCLLFCNKKRLMF